MLLEGKLFEHKGHREYEGVFAHLPSLEDVKYFVTKHQQHRVSVVHLLRKRIVAYPKKSY